jgi:hypothetical protein
MSALTFIDRLRIERAVWTVDAYISILPMRRQREIRRELRANLRASAAQVGAKAAIRNLGSLRRLSYEYLSAEYRGRPWPTPLKGLGWAVVVEVLLVLAWTLTLSAFHDGLAATNPEPGRYTVERPLIGFVSEVTVDSAGDLTEVAFLVSIPVALAWVLVAFVVGSRLWRVIPRWRDRLRERRAQREAGAVADA